MRPTTPFGFRTLALSMLVFVITAIDPAHAQEVGPTRIVAGFAPGGSSDVVARLIVEKMREELGTPVIVENRAGANGMIAAEALKSATPNGKTLMVAPTAVIVFAPLTYSNLRYDPFTDFAPVSLAANFRLVLAVGPGTPAKTLQEYVGWVKANRAKAVYGVPLAGGPGHFLGVLLAQVTGAGLTAVPYKGGGPLAIDLMGGQIPASVKYAFRGHPTAPSRQGANPGDFRNAAVAGRAGHPDFPRARLRRDAVRWMARLFRAGEDAAPNHRSKLCRDRSCHQVS